MQPRLQACRPCACCLRAMCYVLCTCTSLSSLLTCCLALTAPCVSSDPVQHATAGSAGEYAAAGTAHPHIAPSENAPLPAAAAAPTGLAPPLAPPAPPHPPAADHIPLAAAAPSTAAPVAAGASYWRKETRRSLGVKRQQQQRARRGASGL
ncbi:unnamed protein product [Closterium sp. NIES-54]